jgi:hypothetical protein
MLNGSWSRWRKSLPESDQGDWRIVTAGSAVMTIFAVVTSQTEGAVLLGATTIGSAVCLLRSRSRRRK